MLICLNVTYIVSIMRTLKNNGMQWTWSMLIWPILYGWIEKKTFEQIITEIGNGLRPNYSLDIFGVIVGSHVVSIFSDYYGGYILYIIPMYALYKIGGYALSYLKGKSQEATSEEAVDADETEAKRKAKKERKEKIAEKRGG